MANVYFCNCVDDEISVNVNSELSGNLLPPRSVELDQAINYLHMVRYPIVNSSGKKGQFSSTSANNIVIRFATLRKESNLFDIQFGDALFDKDIFIYVFINTLVGQSQEGLAKGISIEVHEVVKKVVQTGLEEIEPAIELFGLRIEDLIKPPDSSDQDD